MARARDIQRVSPVSAPSSKVFDKIVNSAISSKNAPAPLGWSQRLTSTVSPKASAAPVTIAARLTSDPRATTAASFETAGDVPWPARVMERPEARG